MYLISILILLIMIWAVSEFVFGSYIWWKRRTIKHTIRVERTRHHFAEARTKLLKMVRESKIDANSETFKTIYHINTYVMRRPDQYPEISRKVLRAILLSKKEGSLTSEAQDWDQETKEVVRETANALGLIVVDYSRILRIAAWLEDRYGLFTHLAKSLKNREEQKNQVVKDITQAQQSLNNLCAV